MVFYLMVAQAWMDECLLIFIYISVYVEFDQIIKGSEVMCYKKGIKVGLSPSKKICVIFFIESHLKIMNNAFYFILKALFVLKIFKFFQDFLVLQEKRLDQKDKVNFRIHDVSTWFTKNCNTHIAQYLTK